MFRRRQALMHGTILMLGPLFGSRGATPTILPSLTHWPLRAARRDTMHPQHYTHQWATI